MTRVLLDTTALLAHYLDEAGAEVVHHHLEDSDAEILICALSVAEFARRLESLGETVGDARQRALAYAGMCDEVVPVDTACATRAFELSQGAKRRIPLVDSLIAAAAQCAGATLLHRDAHFAAMPELQQVEIGVSDA